MELKYQKSAVYLPQPEDFNEQRDWFNWSQVDHTGVLRYAVMVLNMQVSD